MQFHRSALPLSRRTLNLTARTIRTHHARTGSRWRRLNPAQRALLVLVHLHTGEPFSQVAAGFGVGTATVWRCVSETQAPTLEQGLRRARRKGWG
ncbi:transposase family protein [Nocardiopsis sp. JB363]|uniref:helix-turn-helix domain-containing protein n=1 Tax=Nocardiopsis sp. JB363 TaxID=1434837 RepID=UPI001F28A705|nr:transposase family protein [Nocardiopsis sp. JB363]